MGTRYRPAYAVYRIDHGFLPVVVWAYGQRTDYDVQHSEEAALTVLAEKFAAYGYTLADCERMN